MRFVTIFAFVALAEMATFFWVESQIGLAWALGLALTTAIIGSFLVRRAGVTVLGRIRDKWADGSLPGRELVDGAAILVAGAFLISPGFLTDTLGFLLLIPLVRSWIYKWVSRRYSSRVSIYVTGADASGEQVIDVEELE